MQDTILHSGALTVTLDSKGSPTSAIAGRLPSLDDLARARAYSRYMAPLEPSTSPLDFDEGSEINHGH
jgi:hypothetical protein